MSVDRSQDKVWDVTGTLPVAHHSRIATQPTFEYDRSTHPVRTTWVVEPLELEQVNGWIDIPAKPGLGIEVGRQVVER